MASPSPKTPKPTPFSFRNPRSSSSSSTPTSSPSRSSSTSNLNPSSSANTSATPAEPLLPRHLETIYHRKLRTLLLDHDSAIENWQEVVSDQGAKVAADLARSWSSLESNYQSLQNLRGSQHPKISTSGKLDSGPVEQPPSFQSSQEKASDNYLSGGVMSPLAEAEHRVYISLRKVDEAREQSFQWRGKLQSALSKITSICAATETLLLESSKVKGLEFAFKDAMWGTWTFERFAAAITSVTSQHVLCSSHLLLLLDSLLVSSPLSLSPPPKPSLASSKAVSDDEMDFSRNPNFTKNHSKNRRMKTNDDDGLISSEFYEKASSKRSSILDEWLTLKFVDQFSSSTGSKFNEKGSHGWLMEICEVEVGRWKEGR